MKNIVYGIIDAENTNPNYIDAVLENLSDRITTEPKFKNCYLKIIAIADWTKSTNTQWGKVSYKYNIECLQQFNYSKGSNSSDILITAKTIELINQAANKNESIKGIAIVSSDADFIPLIQKIKQSCIFCIGYLEKNKYKNDLKEMYDKYIEYPSSLIKTPKKNLTLTKLSNQPFKKAILSSPIFIKIFRETNHFLKKRYDVEDNLKFTTTELWRELCISTSNEERSELKTQIKNLNLPNADPKKTLSLISNFLLFHSENFKKINSGAQDSCYLFECKHLFGFKVL